MQGLPCIFSVFRYPKGRVKMKTFYEVVDWDGDGGSSLAFTVAEAEASRDGPRSYVVAIENGWHRRQLNEEEELQLTHARRELARPPRDERKAV